MLIARNIVTVGSATFLSRILGFIRDVAIAALFGAGARADAFFVAFQFVNLVRRLLTEGAVNAALVPLYLRLRGERGEQAASDFAGRLIGTVTLVLAGTAALIALLMPLLILVLAPGFSDDGRRMNAAIEMGRLMLPYLVFAGPLAILMGVFNANNRFGVAAFAAVIFNIAILAALVAIIITGTAGERAGSLLAASVGLAGLCQLVLLVVAIAFGHARVTPLSVSFGPQIGRFVRLAIPGLMASGVPQITTIAGLMVASTSDSAVSWIYYANRLIELPLGIVGIAVGTVLVPAYAHAARNGDRDTIIFTESRGLEIALGLALPAAIALLVLAEPIVRVLFERGAFTSADSLATAGALTALAAGLPGHVLVKAFSSIFFARENTATPMHAALLGLAVAIAGSLALMPLIGHVGIALAISLSGWAGAAMLYVSIRSRLGFSLSDGTRRRLALIVVAACAMGAVIAMAQRFIAAAAGAELSPFWAAAILALLVALGFAVYAALLHALQVVSVRTLAATLLRSP